MGDALVPGGYDDLLEQITSKVRGGHDADAAPSARNCSPCTWRIGRLILIRQENEPWGSGVVKRLANDLPS